MRNEELLAKERHDYSQLSGVQKEYHAFSYMEDLNATKTVVDENMDTEKKKTFEQECKDGRFEYNPNRGFEERCEILRRTAITSNMTYEQRLAMLKARFGV